MRVFALIPALALGACTSFGAPRPADVTLSQTHLTVRMSNGERCIGPRPAGDASQRRRSLAWVYPSPKQEQGPDLLQGALQS